MDFDCTLLQDQYNFWVGTSRENRYLNLGDGDAERYWFAGGRKISWRDCLVDENLAPASHTQARNPTWSNYRWNQQDIFAEMLAGSSAVSQDKAKLGLFVAVTATAMKNPVPTWLLRDSRGLAWTDGQGKDHVRLDKDEGWRAGADFLVAVTQRYGLDQRSSGCLKTPASHWRTRALVAPSKADVGGSDPSLFSCPRGGHARAMDHWCNHR
jgi:hypothetical protein